MNQELKERLNHPGLNCTYIANQLYPNLNPKNAGAKFFSKLNNVQNRKFTDAETAQISEVLNSLADAIKPGNQAAEVNNRGRSFSEANLASVKIDPNVFTRKK